MTDYSNPAGLRRVAMLSPAEQAASDAYETSDASRFELEKAIAAEQNPQKRAILQDLHARQFGGQPGAQSGGGLGAFIDSHGGSGSPQRQPQASLSSFLDSLPAPTPAPAPSGLARRAIGDTAVSLARGVVGVPEAITGLADLVTNGQAGKIQQDLGIDYKRAKDILSEMYSPEQQAANEAVNKAQGFVPTVLAMAQNPSTIVQQAVESSPSMLTGAGIARGTMAIAPKIGPILAGAIGEGGTAAGQNAEQVRQEDPNGTLTPEQSAILALSGMVTGGIGFGAGKVANKMGVGHIATMLANGKAGAVGEDAITKGAGQSLLKKIGEGALTEGVLQELPQSYQEQVAQNIAQGKPWDEGAAAAGAQGMLTGGLMGGAGGPMEGSHHATPGEAIRDSKLPEVGPLTKGLNAGIEYNAQQADKALADAHAAVQAQSQPAPLGLVPQGEQQSNAIHFEADPRFANAPIINGTPAPSAPQFGTKQAADIHIGQSDLLGKAQAVETSPGVFSILPIKPTPEQQTPEQAAELSRQNLAMWMARAPELTLPRAQELKQQMADIHGMDLSVVPHGNGTGYTVMPSNWLAPADRNQAVQEPRAGLLPGPDTKAPDSNVLVAGKDGVRPTTYGDQTAQAQSLAEQQRKADLGLTPDVERAQARRADITAANGQPFKNVASAKRAQALNGGEVVPVEGGHVVRFAPDEAQPAHATSSDLSGDKINKDWTAFSPETGTLGIPRADMPQIRAEHRGPMVNFLNARGIEHSHEVMHPEYLKPTQAEFSPAKVQSAKEFGQADRSILVSKDNHVLDGHHQWLAKREAGEPVKAIRLHAPIKDLLDHVKEFPSAEAADGATKVESTKATEPAEQNSAPAPAPAPAERRAELASKDEVQQQAKISDVGEKIGGARKDTAAKTGSAPKRANSDDRPAWMRRFQISQVAAGPKEGRWVLRDLKNTDWMKQPKQIGGDFATKEEAEAALPLAAVSLKHRPISVSKEGGGTGYEIWRDVSDRKRVKVVNQTFDTRDAAMEYMAKHAADIVQTNTTFGESDLPVPKETGRQGVERRQGDAKAEDFRKAFGFRGVEFGNWNNQAERQKVMNAAYDGLMDLAEVLGMPPQAIGLNGDLGLAFGARGQGLSGARAHYEPERAVMNLTKMKGAGALAHEWFHALDHYLARQDGKASATWKTNEDGTRSFDAKGAGLDMASSGFKARDSGVRLEVREAYETLLKTMFRKAVTYVEDTARADRFVGATREDLTRRLDSLRKELAQQKDPKYYKRKAAPATAEQLAEFDTVAQSLIAGEMLDTEVRYSDKMGARARAMRWSNDALDKISAIYKDVRGRSGFDTTNRNGPMDSIRQAMSLYSARLKMLADAQNSTEKVTQAPTNFAMDAKSLDQGRGTDYWTTPHEMAARAFQGYVEDKVAALGGKSPFLNYAPEGRVIETPWGWKQPYPAGEERKAINAAFDKFMGILETKETDTGTALFSRAPEQNSPEQHALKALSQSDELFRLPKSDQTTVEGIAADNDPDIKVKKLQGIPGRTEYQLTMADGSTARMVVRPANPYGSNTYGFDYADGETSNVLDERPGENPQDVDPEKEDVWIDVSLLKPGQDGAKVYNIASTYAHNTGRIFIGDPAGLSNEALRRRPEQMLSSALKFGTTEHLAPHPRQVTGDKSLGVPPLKWVYGDDVGNIRRLIDLNLASLENAGGNPITFNPATGEYLDSEGENLSRGGIKALAKSGLGSAGGAGRTTLERSAVLSSLLREEGSQAGAGDGRPHGLLGRIVELHSQHRGSTEGIFYSQGPGSGLNKAGGLPLEVGQALAQQFADLGLKDINVAKTLDDIPDAQRQRLEARNTDGVRGIYFPKEDKVWVVLDNVHTPEEFTFVAVHEAFHRGLRSIFGKEATPILRQMYQSNSGLAQRADKLAISLEVSKDEAIEEALADMAAEGSAKQLKGWSKLFAMIRDWASKIAKAAGANIKFTDDMVESFVAGVSKAGLRTDPAKAAHVLTEVPDSVQSTQAQGEESAKFSKASETPPMDRAGALDALHETLSNAASTVGAMKMPAGYLVQDFFKHDGKLSWWHKTVGTPYNLAQRSPQFKRVYDAVQGFINDVSTYANSAADMAPTIIPKLEDLADIRKQPLSPEDTKALSRPVFEGTLNWTRDEDGKPVAATDVSKAGVVWTDAELRDKFGLNDHQIGLYREFRAAVDKSIAGLAISDMLRFGGKDVADLRNAAMSAKSVTEAAGLLNERLTNMANSGPDRAESLRDTSKTILEKAQRAQDLMARGYAPLSRFGQYTVYVSKGDEQLYFGMFESKSDANKMARDMRAQHPDATIQQGTVSQESYRLFAGVSPETLELFGEMLGLESQGDEASHQAFQAYLKLAKTNRSAMKRLIDRKGIAGFSEDAGRVLAGFVYSNARQTSSNLNMREITEGTNAISQKDGELKDAAIKLTEYVSNPQEEAQALRGQLFTQYIGGSVASALVNLTQPATVTFPYLSQFGGVAKAAKQLTQATRDAVKKVTGDRELDAALKKAEDDGVVSPQEIHQLMAQAGGRAGLKSGDGTMIGNLAAQGSNFMSKAMLGWGKLFSTAEQFNRRVTFIAAYRTAVEQGIPHPFAFAEKAVKETQFVMNKGNKPQWARGAVGATLFTFKSYSISYVELISRMWSSGPEGKKAAMLALGMLALMAGTDGLPFEDDLEDVIDGIMQRMGYNFSTKREKAEFLQGLLGEDGAQFVRKGLSGLPGMPIDLAGRLSMGNLIPGTGVLTKKADHSSDMTEVFGAAGDFANRMGTGASALASGNVGDAFDAVAPKAISNLTKAYDMVNTGMYRDAKGRKVIDVTPGEAAMKAIGFQPSSVARVQEAAGEAQSMKDQSNLRKQEITGDLAKAMFDRDASAIQDARDAIKDWNEKNPDTPIQVNGATLRRAVQEMRKSKEQRIAATAPREIRAAVKREMAGSSK